MHKSIVRPLIGLIVLIYTPNQVQQNSWDKAHMKTKILELILLSVVSLSLKFRVKVVPGDETLFRLYHKKNKRIFLV